MALEYGPGGITINAVLPSLTRTAMTEGVPQAVVDASLGRQVIHREAEPATQPSGRCFVPTTLRCFHKSLLTASRLPSAAQRFIKLHYA